MRLRYQLYVPLKKTSCGAPAVNFFERLDVEQVNVDSETSHLWTDTDCNIRIMKTLRSFPPLVNDKTHTLILGSMPGRMSLAQFQYYAHPRNAFWHIMGEVFGAGFDVCYEQRLKILLANGIGLWDVIGGCSRATSLDADIDEETITANNFQELLKRFPTIKFILFNGSKAEQTFNRYVRPKITGMLSGIHLQRLTSTSPANARYSISEKTAIWRVHLHNPYQQIS